MAVYFRIVLDETSVDTSGNKSTVRCRLQTKTTYGSFDNNASYSLSFAGSSYSGGCSVKRSSDYTTIVTKTKTITHNSDGSKTVSASGKIKTSTESGTVSDSASLKLTTIARKSRWVSVPNATLGSSTKVVWDRDSASLTVSLSVSYDGHTKTLLSKADKSSYTWTPPISWVSSKSSATATYTLTTYSGSTKTATTTKTCTFYRPDTKPSISVSETATPSFTASLNNYNTTNYTVKVDVGYEDIDGTYYEAGTLGTIPTAASLPQSFTYTPSADALTTLMECYADISEANIIFTATTYYGSTQINQYVYTHSISSTIADSLIKPTINSIKLSDSFYSTYGVFIKGMSKPRAVINSTFPYGTKIAYADIAYGGETLNLNHTYSSSYSETLPAVSDSSFIVIGKVMNKNGVVSNRYQSGAYTAIDYTKPTLTVNAYRTNSSGVRDDEGEYYKVVSQINTTSINGKNTITYKVVDGTTTVQSSNPSAGAQQITYQSTSSIGKDTTHKITVSVYDGITTNSQTVEITPTFTLMSFYKDGKGIAIGKSAASTNLLDIALPTTIKGGLNADSIKENGTLLSAKYLPTTGGSMSGTYGGGSELTFTGNYINLGSSSNKARAVSVNASSNFNVRAPQMDVHGSAYISDTLKAKEIYLVNIGIGTYPIGAVWHASGSGSKSISSGTSYKSLQSMCSVTLPKGNYIFTALVGFASNATGNRSLRINIGGTTYGSSTQTVRAASGTRTYLTTLTIGVIAESSNYLTASVWQDSGKSLDVTSCQVRAIRIGNYSDWVV